MLSSYRGKQLFSQFSANNLRVRHIIDARAPFLVCIVCNKIKNHAKQLNYDNYDRGGKISSVGMALVYLLHAKSIKLQKQKI